MLLMAEGWFEKPEDIVIRPEWVKLDALLAKELKKILNKEVNLLMEVCTMEDKALRTSRNNFQVYQST